MRQRDWQPLLGTFKQAIDQAIDLAVERSLEFPTYIAAFERTRRFAHAWLDGRRCSIATEDLLLTIGTILCEVELDLGIDSAALLAPLLNAPSDRLHIAGTRRAFARRPSRARARAHRPRTIQPVIRPASFPI